MSHYLIEFPAGKGPFPVLLMAPGLRYDMQRPVFETLRTELLAHGIAIVRWNWAFYTSDAVGGLPSADLSDELAEMEFILAEVLKDVRTDRRSVFVGGKSLGSIVASQLLHKQKNIAGGILLTPLCAVGQAADQYYTGVIHTSCPVLLIAGDDDQHCDLQALYDLARLARGKCLVTVFSGDHQLEYASRHDIATMPEKRADLSLMAATVTAFIARYRC
jgi:predicted alpha/beta-hydrolase family hydrolase